MSEIDATEALRTFAALSPSLVFPGAHPAYVTTDALREAGLTPRFFRYERSGDVLYYPVHWSNTPIEPWNDIQAPYGYGGPLASTSDPDFLRSAWAAFDSWCLDLKVLAEFIRFHPVSENWRFFPGRVVEDRPTVVVDLGQAESLEGYDVRVRTAVRKARKLGLTVSWWAPTEFMSHFVPIYRATMAAAGADAFYQFPESYMRELVSLPFASLGVALTPSGEVAAAGVFLVAGETAEYHLSGQTPEGRRLGATTLLLHEAASRVAQLGACRLHLGGGTSAAPDNPLFFFKSGFSRERRLFKFGGRIHDPSAYDTARLRWKEEHGKVSSRILFYR